MSSLYILNTNSLSDISFANIFHSVGCLLVLLIVYFAVQKFFILNIFLTFIHFLIETEHEWGRGREREGDTESKAGSRLQTDSTEPDEGLELTDHEIMT